MTHIATIHNFRQHHRAAKRDHALERKTKRHTHLAAPSKTSHQPKISVMPLRSYGDARAIAGEEMATLVADGGSLVLSPCSVGWIASCRWVDKAKSPARRAWSLAIFDEGEKVTMHYPAIEVRFLELMIEAEGAYEHHETELSFVPTPITHLQSLEQISAPAVSSEHHSMRLEKVWQRHAA